jgi:hypothetical protein
MGVTMKTAYLKALLATAVLLLLLTLLPAVWAGESPGYYQVSVLTDLGWWNVGRFVYNQDLSEQLVGLPRLPLADPVRVRVTHEGDTAAHIDALRLGDQMPLAVDGAAEPSGLALKKLAAHDYDLIDAKGRTLDFTFQSDSAVTYLALVARIEPEVISDVPFRFPLENVGKEMTTSSAFYLYELGSRSGSLTMDGELAGENLGKPFFVEFARAGSGHPSTNTYGWVRDDGEFLFVAIDLVGDNTLDGDKDYSAVYAVTPTGLHRFELSVPNQTWGKPGFTYTAAEAYQHKVYEYRIPFEDLHLNVGTSNTVIQLAFEAYGTVSPEPPTPTRDTDPTAGPVGGQTISSTSVPARSVTLGLAAVSCAVIIITTAALFRRRRQHKS